MEKLLYYIIENLVETKEEINIKKLKKDFKTIIFKVRVADGELGRVIGKNGITASAIRGVMQAAGVKERLNVEVEFLD